MTRLWRSMPWGVRGFLAYAFLLLALASLMLPLIVSQAVEAPISAIGVVWMLLLAYLVFTLTLVLQRKQAAWWMALGLATLTIPLVPLLGIAAGLPGAVAAIILSVAVIGGLVERRARAWFTEP
jgi:hypothetical protein